MEDKSNWPAPKSVKQLDEQDEDDRELEPEGAALVVLLDHVAVQAFGGLELLGDEVAVVGDADLAGRQPVEAGGEHVAEELDGVVGVLAQFGNFKENRLQAGGRSRQAPACEPAAFLGQGVVDAVEDPGEQFVVMAKTWDYSRMDFVCEVSANRKAVYLNLLFWAHFDFRAHNIDAQQLDSTIAHICEAWEFNQIEIALPAYR